MSSTCLFEKVTELKESFKKSFIHRKKHKSLKTYSEVVDLPEEQTAAMSLLEYKMKSGFLSDKLASFLDVFLEENEINFLDWSHKTKWLKNKIQEMKKDQVLAKTVQLTMFDYPQMKQYAAPHVPFELLAKMQKGRMERRL